MPPLRRTCHVRSGQLIAELVRVLRETGREPGMGPALWHMLMVVAATIDETKRILSAAP